jgi:superoxide reductase
MEIQKPKDPDFLNDFEKKHIPFVELPKKIKPGQELELKVKLGEITHPMIPEHYIMWVALYDGENLLQKNKLKPDTPAETGFKLKVLTDMPNLRCLAGCNIHGVWEKKFSLILN